MWYNFKLCLQRRLKYKMRQRIHFCTYLLRSSINGINIRFVQLYIHLGYSIRSSTPAHQRSIQNWRHNSFLRKSYVPTSSVSLHVAYLLIYLLTYERCGVHIMCQNIRVCRQWERCERARDREMLTVGGHFAACEWNLTRRPAIACTLQISSFCLNGTLIGQ
jgi:hypothetical protein